MYSRSFHRTLILLAAVIFSFSCEIFAQERENKFVPSAGKTLVIIGQDTNAADRYVSEVGPTPGGFMGYTSIQHLEGIYQPSDVGGGLQYAQYLANKYPNTVMQIGLWMVNGLDGVNSGEYDANIDSFGQWAKSVNRPIYLRIGYEFDYPSNNYDPQKYVQAYQHIVNRLNSGGVENVSYVWHSWAGSTGNPVNDWYPGDGYVDWVAVSYFDQSPQYRDALAAIAQEHGKPLMIAESTPLGIGTLGGEVSWDTWFKEYFDFINKNDVRALSYINWDWGTIPMFSDWGWGNCQIQDNEFVKQMWLAELSRSRYLQSSGTLFSELGYAVVPEPSALLLFGAGGGLLGLLFRKNKKSVKSL